jgi:glycosyltransferase involved in cell wall biosynthesis
MIMRWETGRRNGRVLEDRGGGRKRVCVDGRLLAAEATGVATYARTVVAALAATGDPPLILCDGAGGRFASVEGRFAQGRRWLAARTSRAVSLVPRGAELFAPDVFRRAQARFNASGRLLELVAPGPPGVMHWTWPVPARIVGWANLYTVHDVIPLADPELGTTNAAGFRARLDALLASGAWLASVSEHARREILAALDIAPARVLDCGSAVEVASPAEPLPAGMEPGFFLFCGSTEPRKNLERILAAWRAAETSRPLVLAGHSPRGDRGAGVIELGFVPRPLLLSLLAAARALVFPTLAEGFGLPVIEAMALGTPVLTSDRGALAEVAGGAALAVDPRDVVAIGGAIARLDREDALCAGLAVAGLRRARHFSLADFGIRLRRAYGEIAGDLPDAA